jgi:hypothetical protein
MRWLGLVARVFPVVGVVALLMTVAWYIDTRRDAFCTRSVDDKSRRAISNAHFVELYVANVSKTLGIISHADQGGATFALGWARLEGQYALGVSVLRSGSGITLPTYTQQECQNMRASVAAAEVVLKSLRERYGRYVVIEPESTPPDTGPVVAAMPPKGS